MGSLNIPWLTVFEVFALLLIGKAYNIREVVKIVIVRTIEDFNHSRSTMIPIQCAENRFYLIIYLFYVFNFILGLIVI